MVSLFSADHWRKQAEQARATALNFETEESRQAVLRVAESYDRLAEIAEKRVVPPAKSDMSGYPIDRRYFHRVRLSHRQL